MGNDVALQLPLQSCNCRFRGKPGGTPMTTIFCVLVATEVVVIGPGVLVGTVRVSSRLL
jgi:hypothetical protein